jgi:hypothetical protein
MFNLVIVLAALCAMLDAKLGQESGELYVSDYRANSIVVTGRDTSRGYIVDYYVCMDAYEDNSVHTYVGTTAACNDAWNVPEYLFIALDCEIDADATLPNGGVYNRCFTIDPDDIHHTYISLVAR